MKHKLILAAFAATSLAANAATVVLDNYSTEQNGATAGAVGNYAVQSFTPTVAGLGALDTVDENSPLPATVYLQSTSFLKAVSGTGSTVGSLYINVYQGAGNGGTFLGSSTNAIDVANAAALSSLDWTFNNIPLTDSSAQYAFVFSSTNTNDTPGVARLQVARTAAGTFANTYDGGSASANANGTGPTSYEPRFSVQFNTVPEPSTALLGALGLLGLLCRRR